MIKLQILGAGCPKCQKLAEIVKAVADTQGLEYQLEKVTQINEIMKFNVMVTPALVVDGLVKAAGRIPTEDEIKTWLTTNPKKA